MSGFLSGQFLAFAPQIARVTRTKDKSETGSRHIGYIWCMTLPWRKICAIGACMPYWHITYMYSRCANIGFRGVESVHITVKIAFMAIQPLPALLAFMRVTTSHWWIPDIANNPQYDYQTSHNYHKSDLLTFIVFEGTGTSIWMTLYKTA